MKNKRCFWVSFSFLILLIGIIGFLLGKIINIPGVTVDTKINPLHALSILTPVIITIFISILFDREREKKRNAKQEILRSINILSDFIEIFNKQIMEKDNEYNSILAIIKRIRTKFECINKMLSISNMKPHYEVFPIYEMLQHIHQSATSTSIEKISINGPGPIAVVKKNKIKYSKALISLIDFQLNSLKNVIAEFQMAIIFC